MLKVTGKLPCNRSQESCDSRLLCQSLFSGWHRILYAKKLEGKKKTDNDSHVFMYDTNTKWKMQDKESWNEGGKENS